MLYACSGLKSFTVPADLPEDISLPGASVIDGKEAYTDDGKNNYYWVDSNGIECTVAAKNISTSMTYSRKEKTSSGSIRSTGRSS